MKNSFYDLLKMIREKRIREGDILVVYSKIEENFIDYYIVQNKDIKWLRASENDCIYLFDNFFLIDLLENYCFKVIFKDKEKQEILDKLQNKRRV